MEQPGGRGYLLKSRLREPPNPLSRMPCFHQAVRYCSLRYSAASVSQGRAKEPAGSTGSPGYGNVNISEQSRTVSQRTVAHRSVEPSH